MRGLLIVLLAIIDLAIAGVLVAAGVAGRGPVRPGAASTLLLPIMLAVKGLLTLLPADPQSETALTP